MNLGTGAAVVVHDAVQEWMPIVDMQAEIDLAKRKPDLKNLIWGRDT